MEEWKPLRNFPSYDGSTEGRIMNVRTQRILKPNIGDKGYPQVSLYKNNKPHTVRVSRVIADTFLGEHPDLDVRYRDNNKLNTRVENLYYSTRKETISDMRKRSNKKSPRSTAIRVIETGAVYRSATECSRETGCDRSAIFKQLAGTVPHVKGLHFERV